MQGADAGSLSYAARLTQNVDYGVCGLPETHDTSRVFAKEAAKLVDVFRTSKYLVVHTGAGLSTSCGIRDFRGPEGVWTNEKKGKGLAMLPGDVDFEEASPSVGHMAILALQEQGFIKYVVSQNVDGLHLRSGLPTECLAELHGNIFQESCKNCSRVYFRNFDVGGCGFGPTARKCEWCSGQLFDMVLDWEDALPEEDSSNAQLHCGLADFSLCLGTSLRVHPAATYPLITTEKGSKTIKDEPFCDFELTPEQQKQLQVPGKIGIVNLQQTPFDSRAHVRLHSKIDDVLIHVCAELEVFIPPFVRRETYYVKTWMEASRQLLSVSSDIHGTQCLFVDTISAVNEQGQLVAQAKKVAGQPFACIELAPSFVDNSVVKQEPEPSEKRPKVSPPLIMITLTFNENSTECEAKLAPHQCSEGKKVSQHQVLVVRKYVSVKDEHQ